MSCRVRKLQRYGDMEISSMVRKKHNMWHWTNVFFFVFLIATKINFYLHILLKSSAEKDKMFSVSLPKIFCKQYNFRRFPIDNMNIHMGLPLG